MQMNMALLLDMVKAKKNETGYQYEPWHLRYLGKEKAKEVKESGQSLESYLGLYPKNNKNKAEIHDG